TPNGHGANVSRCRKRHWFEREREAAWHWSRRCCRWRSRVTLTESAASPIRTPTAMPCSRPCGQKNVRKPGRGAEPASGARQDGESYRLWTWPPAEPSTQAPLGQSRKMGAEDPHRSQTWYVQSRPQVAVGSAHPIRQRDRKRCRQRYALCRRRMKRVPSFAETSRANASLLASGRV